MSIPKGRPATPQQTANITDTTLDKLAKTDPDRAREIHSMGGKASRKKAQERAHFRQAAIWLAGMPAFKTDNEAVEALREKFPEITNAQAMTAAVMKRAMQEGDAKSYVAIRDTAGETPASALDLSNGPLEISIKTVE